MKNISGIACLGLSLHLAACGGSPNSSKIKEDTVAKGQTLHERVIYGEDDRKDIYQVTDTKLLALAKGTAALVQSSQLQSSGTNQYSLATTNFGTDYNLCQSEPFRDQDAAAFCSGFLVSPHLLVTAGHCVRTETECRRTNFVFDYDIATAGSAGPRTLPAKNVYSCKRLVKSQAVSPGADFAIVELDRDVVGRTPLKIRRAGQISTGESLVMIGHPAGIPTKIAGGANVRQVKSGFFVANTDSYGGNSGSAVFNNSTGEVEGILVRGETDFVYQGTCRVSKVCSNDACRGEDATIITEIIPHLVVKTKREVNLDFDRLWRGDRASF